MNIGEPQKVTEEPRPIRAPRFVPQPRVPERERFPEREKVPIGVPRRAPERAPERQKEASISFSEGLNSCPYCSSDLVEKEMDYGTFLACPKHGLLEVV